MHDNELVWDAEPKNPITAGNISGVVTYGVPPKDWINKLTPPALVCGKAYLVNPGAHYFALKCDGTVVVFDAPHLEEFFNQTSGNVHASVVGLHRRHGRSATPVRFRFGQRNE